MPQVVTQEVFSQVPVPKMSPVDVFVPTPVLQTAKRVVVAPSHRSWTGQFLGVRR